MKYLTTAPLTSFARYAHAQCSAAAYTLEVRHRRIFLVCPSLGLKPIKVDMRSPYWILDLILLFDQFVETCWISLLHP